MSIEAEIAAGLHSAQVEHHLDKFAEKIRDELRDLAPVFDAERDRRSTPGIGEEAGDFRRSIVVMSSPKPGHRRVGSESPIAMWQEFGTRHFPEMAIFAKVARMHGGTGPVVDEGVQHAQHKLRRELETLAKLRATGNTASMADALVRAKSIADQRRAVDRARLERSAAFKAARGSRGGRRRSR